MSDQILEDVVQLKKLVAEVESHYKSRAFSGLTLAQEAQQRHCERTGMWG